MAKGYKIDGTYSGKVFVKGHTSWSKGKKTGIAPTSAFKKGHHSKSEFKKGDNLGHPNYLKSHTKEARLKMSNSLKGKYKGVLSSSYGKKQSLETVKKRSISAKKVGVGKWMKGKKFSEKTRQKMSDKRKGSLHPNWMGGKSFEPYGIIFNKELKDKIRERDGFRCQECFRHQDELYYKDGRKYKLDIHHVDYNKTNNNENNLISL